jgi:hypothetical protein
MEKTFFAKKVLFYYLTPGLSPALFTAETLRYGVGAKHASPLPLFCRQFIIFSAHFADVFPHLRFGRTRLA